MEGKEVRFGIANSALFATVTTDASCGAVNSHARQLHAHRRPGPAVQHHDRRGHLRRRRRGLYGILLYCILAVFIAGLMVGRTPEYLGKKIEQKEVKMAMLAVIATAFSILVFSCTQRRDPLPGQGLLESARAGHRQPEQQRPARLQRDSVRLRQRHGQQRQRLWRARPRTRPGTT